MALAAVAAHIVANAAHASLAAGAIAAFAAAESVGMLVAAVAFIPTAVVAVAVVEAVDDAVDLFIKQSKLTFMHSIFYNYAPTSFEHVWAKNRDRQLSQNLRNENEFRLPNPRIEFFKKLPSYSLPLEWNNAGDLVFYDNKT